MATLPWRLFLGAFSGGLPLAAMNYSHRAAERIVAYLQRIFLDADEVAFAERLGLLIPRCFRL